MSGTATYRDQRRLKALEVANETRVKRAHFRRQAERADVREAILSPPSWLERADIEWVLLACSGIGTGKAASILRSQQISSTRPLRSLTRRQRHLLAEEIR